MFGSLLKSTLGLAAGAGLLVLAPSTSSAQSVAGLYAQVNGLTSRIQQAQNQSIQRGMQNPQIRASYSQYAAQMAASGRQPIPFAAYTYQYMATGGFTAQGRAMLAASDAQNRAKIQGAVRDLRETEGYRGQIQMAGQASAAARSNAAGQILQGVSPFVGPNGSQMDLPHTWQTNTTNTYNGVTYHVDQSGNYWQYGGNGVWYPLRPR